MPLDEQHLDLLVVGGGPAGMSAAQTAADAGLEVLLVDERPTLGGQIYKQPGPGFSITDPSAGDRESRFGRSLVAATLDAPARVRLRTGVVALEAQPAGGFAVTLVTDGAAAETLRVPRILLAPGAHDRPVVFPGWTLPGVITAGGLQSLAKNQWVLPPGRIVFAGSGPVALAFPAQLARYGADIVCALEAGRTPRGSDVARIASAARGNATILWDAARYRAQLVRCRIPLRYGRIVVRAEGSERVQRVVHAAVDADWRVIPGTEVSVAADVLCIGYGFVASVELLRLTGCDFDFDDDLGGLVVRRDPWGRTSVRGVYTAGDGAGVEGSYVALDEGTVAGLAAAIDASRLEIARAEELAGPPRARLEARRRLGAATRPLFQVGRGLYELAAPDTVVCRCESVRQADVDRAVAASDDINVVKALTRAGMGPCQGKNCQRHIAACISKRHGVAMDEVPLATARMPVRPVPISAMADPAVVDPGLFLPEPVADASALESLQAGR